MGFESETIGGLTFCVAKKEPPQKRGIHYWILLLLVYLGVCRLAISLAAGGNSYWTWIAIAPLFAVLLAAACTYFRAEILLDRQQRAAVKKMPQGVFPCEVDTSSTQAIGWVLIDKGWLHFESDHFCFRLKPSDVDHIYHEGYLNVGIKLPGEFPPLDFCLHALRITERKTRHEMLQAIVDWSRGDDPIGDSLLPPILLDKSSQPELYQVFYMFSLVLGSSGLSLVVLTFEYIPKDKWLAVLFLSLIPPSLALTGWWLQRHQRPSARQVKLDALRGKN